MGVEVWRYTGKGLSDMYKSYPITWDLTDGSGTRVPGGIYLYKAIISTDNEHETTRSKKTLCDRQRIACFFDKDIHRRFLLRDRVKNI